MSTLPKLYAFDASKKLREWSVRVEDNTIICTHGLVEGKKIASRRQFEGKNVGRKNETSSEKQASLEATREWIKRLNKGYRVYNKKEHGVVEGLKESLKDILKQKEMLAEMAKQNNLGIGLEEVFDGKKPNKNVNVRSTENMEYQRISPMLCQKWENKPSCKKHFSHPKGFFLQRKFDGVRVLCAKVGEEVVFWSRGGKNYPHLSKLKESIKEFYDLLGEKYPDRQFVFDGELYAHVIKGKQVVKGKKVDYVPAKSILGDSERFDVIAGIGKPARSSPHPLEDQMQYHIFDLVDENLLQHKRFELLDEIFELLEDEAPIKKVETILTKKEEDIYDYHDEWAQDGYEGVIVRAYDCPYVGKRNLKIRKYKEFQDSEYEIVGAKVDQGVDEEFFVWIMSDGKKEFRAKPMGTRAARVAMYQNSDDYIGKMATIRYQKLSKDGVPIFGRFVRVREDGV